MNYISRKLRRNQTDAEQKLWYFLRNRRLSGCKFRRQHVIGQYVADFCCVEKNLIIELDGSQHMSQQLQDQLRTSYLNSKGYRILRFWDDKILKETELVLEVIRLALDDPHPNPLPERERGE